jgi:ribosomal protein S18 acetylase RimI-like enzyme
MVRFIRTEDTLSIRNEILREGKLQIDECRFPGDDNDTSFHLGYFFNDKLVSIATFHQQKLNDTFSEIKPVYLSVLNQPGASFQLRGMATLSGYRKKGFGNQLVNFAIVYLRGKKVNYLWCNARKGHISFYLGLGFEVISDEFEIPDIGPHKTMYLKI